MRREEGVGKMERIKIIRSHKGYARWLADVAEEPLGYIPKQNIPSPYYYGPVHTVYCWQNQQVIAVETAHRIYEIFAVPAEIVVQKED